MELTQMGPTSIAARLTVLEARTLTFWLRSASKDDANSPNVNSTADAIEQARLAATANLDAMGPANFADCTSAVMVKQHFDRKQAEAKLGPVVGTTLGLLDLMLITAKAQDTISQAMSTVVNPAEVYERTMQTPPDALDPPEVHRLFELEELSVRDDIIGTMRNSSLLEVQVAHGILTAVDLYIGSPRSGGPSAPTI